jgi:hypothetical protein
MTVHPLFRALVIGLTGGAALGLVTISLIGALAGSSPAPAVTPSPGPTSVPQTLARPDAPTVTASQRQQTPTLARPDAADFRILEYHWNADPQQVARGYVRIVGEVENQGSVPAGVKLQAITRDSRDLVTGSDDWWVAGTRNLAPGGREPINHLVRTDGVMSLELRVVDARAW